jgi:hypothetical protein
MNGRTLQDIALDLSAEEDRPRIKLPDGKLYALRLPGDFSLVEQTRMQRHMRTIRRITEGEGDLTPDEEESLTRGYTHLISLLLPDAPDTVRDALSDRARARLIEYFASLAQTAGTTQPTSPDGPPTSPTSRGTTAGTRRTG